MIGKAKMSMKAALTFACLNMKKLAKLLDRLDGDDDDFPLFTKILAILFKKSIYFRIDIKKASINLIY